MLEDSAATLHRWSGAGSLSLRTRALSLSLPSEALVSVPGLLQGGGLLSLPQPRLRGHQRCLLWHLMPGGTQGKPCFRV